MANLALAAIARLQQRLHHHRVPLHDGVTPAVPSPGTDA
jgi:hypothetical protein